MSNNDKHRSLLEVNLKLSSFELMGVGGIILNYHTQRITLDPMGYLNNFKSPNFEVGDVVFNAFVPDLFIENDVFAGYAKPIIDLYGEKSLIQTLKRITDFAELIIKTIVASI